MSLIYVFSERVVNKMDLARRVLVGALSGIAMRALGVLCQLILTAIVMRAWTPGQFGLWSLVLSTTLLLAVFDFGVSSALQNRLVVEKEGGARLYWAAFTLFFALSLVVGAIAVKFVGLLGMGPIMTLLVGLMVLKQPLGLCRGVFLSWQRADLVAWIEGASAVLGVAIVAHGIFWNWSFEAIVFAYLSSLILPWIVAQVALCFVLPFTIVTLGEAYSIVRDLAAPAMGLWLLNLFSLAIISTDDWIINYTVGVEAVGEVVNIRRLFNLILLINWSILTPMWSAYTVSHVSGDTKWIWKGLRRSFLATLGVVFVLGGWIYMAHPWILHVWTGTRVLEKELAMGLWIMTAVVTLNATLSTLLNGIGVIGKQVVANGLAAVVNITLSIYWGREAGVLGVIAATCVVFALLALFNAFLISRTVKS